MLSPVESFTLLSRLQCKSIALGTVLRHKNTKKINLKNCEKDGCEDQPRSFGEMKMLIDEYIKKQQSTTNAVFEQGLKFLQVVQ